MCSSDLFTPQIIPTIKKFELHRVRSRTFPEEKVATNDAKSEILEVLFEIVFLLSKYVCRMVVSVPPSNTTNTNL